MQKSIEVQQENTIIYSFSAILAGLYFYIFRKMIGIWGLWAFPIFGILAYVIVHLKDKTVPPAKTYFTGVTGSNNIETFSVKGKDGINGSDGIDGSSFLSGAGLPVNSSGKNGDTYLDTQSGQLYKKENNTWF